MHLSRTRHFALYLIWLCTVLTACSGNEPIDPEQLQAAAFADLRDTVERVVVDDDREDEILALVDNLERELASLRAGLLERRQAFRRINADYDTTLEEMTAFVDTIELRLAEDRARFVEARNQLIENTTPEQWAAIAKVETKTMQSLVDALLVL